MRSKLFFQAFDENEKLVASAVAVQKRTLINKVKTLSLEKTILIKVEKITYGSVKSASVSINKENLIEKLQESLNLLN